VIWKDNRIQTNQANQVLPGNTVADNRKNARDRNVNANSANARNTAGVGTKNVVAASKADKPAYLGQEAAGDDSRRFACLSTSRINHA
jgi:hypothetical protein